LDVFTGGHNGAHLVTSSIYVKCQNLPIYLVREKCDHHATLFNGLKAFGSADSRSHFSTIYTPLTAAFFHANGIERQTEILHFRYATSPTAND